VSQKGNGPAAASEERASKEAALRAYLGRILGWERTQAIEHALRSVELSSTYRAALVLVGHAGLVPSALALHLRTRGAARPFVVVNPRRVDMPATSYKSGVAAVPDARGGPHCIDLRRRPAEFDAAAVEVRATDVQLVLCSDVFQAMHPFLIRPVPIRVPPLKARAHELPRIVDEYARDAIEALGVDDAGFTAADRTWVLDHAARTLPEIETATLRRVALRQAGSIVGAAKRLGMSHVALLQWLDRRRTGGAS
jgi:hypothetical protein